MLWLILLKIDESCGTLCFDTFDQPNRITAWRFLIFVTGTAKQIPSSLLGQECFVLTLIGYLSGIAMSAIKAEGV